MDKNLEKERMNKMTEYKLLKQKILEKNALKIY